MAADGPAFVAAAVGAAVQHKAPRRTVEAIAAAVARVFAHPPTARAAPRKEPSVPTGTLRAAGAAGEADDPAQLLASIHAHRRAQRIRKKERRRAAKQADRDSYALDKNEDAAGHAAESGDPAAAPAPVSWSPPPSQPPREVGAGLLLADQAMESDALLSSLSGRFVDHRSELYQRAPPPVSDRSCYSLRPFDAGSAARSWTSQRPESIRSKRDADAVGAAISEGRSSLPRDATTVRQDRSGPSWHQPSCSQSTCGRTSLAQPSVRGSFIGPFRAQE